MGQGMIRERARDELRRQSALRQDSSATLHMLRELVAELAEAEVSASLAVLPIPYMDQSLTAVLTLPPIHPAGGGAIPAWPDEIPAAAAYSVRVYPGKSLVDIEGPLALLADGSPDPEDDDRRDPVYYERFKTGGGAGFPLLSDLVVRIRGLAIMREMSLQSSAGGPAP